MGVQNQPLTATAHRKGLYSSVKVRLRGQAPTFTITKVKTHVDIEGLTDPEERCRAQGNDAADRVAKQAAEDLLAQPGRAELEDWEKQVSFLHAFSKFVPQALE